MSPEKTTLEIIAPTIEEAVSKGMNQLGLPREAIDVEVLDAGSRGLFGLGSRQARVRLTIHGVDSKPAVIAPVAELDEAVDEEEEEDAAEAAAPPDEAGTAADGARADEEAEAEDEAEAAAGWRADEGKKRVGSSGESVKSSSTSTLR